MRRQVLLALGQEKCLLNVRLLECEFLKHPILYIVLSLLSFSLKDLSILFIQIIISIEWILIISHEKNNHKQVEFRRKIAGKNESFLIYQKSALIGNLHK